jgi:uncharacterized oxidoreductase
MQPVAAGDLERVVADIVRAVGASTADAAIVAGSLVRSNLKGVDSHGVMRVPEYVRCVDEGRIVPTASARVDQRGGVVRVDGGWCFGQVAALAGADAAVQAALTAGVAAATISRVHHVGRLGEYVEHCADRGLVGLAFCNTGPAGGRVAPFGGRTAALATNPIAYAVPREGTPPLVADFSTSAAAEGRVRLARDNGDSVPAGWLQDAAGVPTTDPGNLYVGGSLLPAGGHRGYALGLLAEILGGGLAGAGCASLGATPGNGLVLVVLDPGAWGDAGSFGSLAGEVGRAMLAVEPAPGVDRVRLPGDPERECEERRRREGIPLDRATRQAIDEIARSLGVEPL